jgi:OmpA-OmpF porin, OOP family
MTKSALAIVAVAATLFALPAQAQRAPEPGFYVGGTIGESKWKDACSGLGGGVSCDDTDTAVKIFGGYQMNQFFAGEFGYVNLGKSKASSGPFTDDIKAHAWELSAVGSWPVVDRFSIFGRLGLYFADVEEDTNFAGNFKHSNNDLTFGFGVRYDFTRNLAVRGEWQRYNDVGGGDIGKSDIDLLGITLIWKF